jgi:hypothetical protein
MSLDKTEVLARRFRHCAARSLMILRTYKGNRKSVGKQQMSSRLLINSVRRISENFPILKEARREILEDLMDIKNAEKVIEHIEHKRITITEIQTNMPSPFAFNIITMGYTDIMKMEDKLQFLKRMHDMVRAKISLKHKGTKKVEKEKYNFDYDEFWKGQDLEKAREKDEKIERLKMDAWNLKTVPFPVKEKIVEIIEGSKNIRQDFIEAMNMFKTEIKDNWPKELRDFLIERLKKLGELPEDY